MDIGGWLRGLGLERYEQAFRENEIDEEVLPGLTADDLKDLGVALVGHRRRLLDAIAALAAAPPAAVASAREERGAAVSAEAERRQLTVMFCDLVGSTRLSTRFDPEDLREIVGAYHRCVTDTVSRFGGFVAKYMGDGVLIYFGYPEAHEDDAERAVRAGLAVIDEVDRLATQEALNVRLGIATGLVVVGDLIGAGAAQERGVVGETPNLAARLQALARPGTLVIADNTRRQIGTLFEIEDLGAQPLAGFAEPQRAWRVIGESGVASRFEALRSGTTPLIGRDEELDLLLRRWQQAKSGEGRVVLVSGEPGIGKSRLTAALSAHIESEPYTRLRYFCSPHHQDSALYPFIGQLERAAGFARDDTAMMKLDKLEALLGDGAEPGDLSLIAEMLSLSGGERFPPLDLSPQRKKERTLAALLRQLQAVARRQPVLMTFEDLHWIDPTSREVLDLTVERITTLPVLLLATYRPEFQPPWVGGSQVTVIALNRLGRSEGATLVARLTGNLGALPPDIVGEIVERTDGVPLFVEELTKAVVEAGADRGYASISAVPPSSLAVPATLHASLLGRLDRLGPSAKTVAQVGAVIGRDFSYELLEAAVPLAEPELQEALRRLVEAGLVFQRGVPPTAEYLFKHALVQDTAYSTLLRGRRQQIHAHLASIVEAQFPDIVKAQPELLAQHFTEAGLTQKAVAYLLKAGQHMLMRSANAEAITQLRKGLALATSLAETPQRQQHELELQLALGSALTAAKGPAAPDVGETFVRARALAEQMGRPEYLVPPIMGQWAFHLVRAEHKLALSVAEQLEEIGKGRNDVAVELQGRAAHGQTAFFLGDFEDARAVQEPGLNLSDPSYRMLGAELYFDQYPPLLAFLALALACLGYLDQARSRMAEGLLEARRLGRPYTLACLVSWAGWMHRIIRSPGAEQLSEELHAISAEHGYTFWLGWGVAAHGRQLAAAGKAEEGAALIAQGLASVRATGGIVATPTALLYLAEAYARLGQPSEGLNSLAEAEQIIETTDERLDEAELHRLRGDLLNAAGDRPAAERSYRQAIAVAERQRAKLLQLRASVHLARLWRDEGKHAEARELLAPIYGWFTEGFDTADLKEAAALLAELA
jgi:class 3 adenylate cyclase/tetratricopeptide (TPR) repeat protein